MNKLDKSILATVVVDGTIKLGKVAFIIWFIIRVLSHVGWS